MDDIEELKRQVALDCRRIAKSLKKINRYQDLVDCEEYLSELIVMVTDKQNMAIDRDCKDFGLGKSLGK